MVDIGLQPNNSSSPLFTSITSHTCTLTRERERGDREKEEREKFKLRFWERERREGRTARRERERESNIGPHTHWSLEPIWYDVPFSEQTQTFQTHQNQNHLPIHSLSLSYQTDKIKCAQNRERSTAALASLEQTTPIYRKARKINSGLKGGEKEGYAACGSSPCCWMLPFSVTHKDSGEVNIISSIRFDYLSFFVLLMLILSSMESFLLLNFSMSFVFGGLFSLYSLRVWFVLGGSIVSADVVQKALCEFGFIFFQESDFAGGGR